MWRVAHISDVHILDGRGTAARARYRFATKFVGFGRSVDPSARSGRLRRALALAKARGAQHVVISGDLTEVGEVAEFEQFAEVLEESGFPPDGITLVPGNHDAYTAGGFKKALSGPLSPFASGSATAEVTSVAAVDRGPIVFLPVDTTRFQTMAWSGGEFTRSTAEAVERRVSDPALRDKAVVLVLHHPPFYPRSSPLTRWVDGLRGYAEVLGLLARNPRLQILHGHLHRVVDRILGARDLEEAKTGSQVRVFGAPATCEDKEESPRIRLYDVLGGGLHAVA